MKKKKSKKRRAPEGKRGKRSKAPGKRVKKRIKREKGIGKEEKVGKTSIQIGTDTRDRLYRLKFRRSYDHFLKELCELYEKEHGE